MCCEYYFCLRKKIIVDENKIPKRNAAMKRTNRVGFALNEEEVKTFNRFLNKYHLNNKSHWMRETIMTAILKRLEEDYPTLFEESEMHRR